MQVEFPEGTIVRFSANFSDEESGSSVNPGQVAFGYRVNGGSPVQFIYVSGGTTSGTIINDAVGTFHIDVDTTGQAGAWTFEWESKGVGQASKPGAITVSASPITIVWGS